jgi:hypothetical protein
LALAAILTLGCGDSTSPAEPTIGAIEITVSTTGASVDIDPDGYMVSVNSGSYLVVGVNDNVKFRALPKGKYFVLLDGVAPNCSVTGINPSSVDVVANQDSPVSFSVSCTTKPGDAAPGGWDY